MYLTKKHLPRRTVLKGLGATIALPFLDAMLPAAHGVRQGATGEAAPARRDRDGARRRRQHAVRR